MNQKDSDDDTSSSEEEEESSEEESKQDGPNGPSKSSRHNADDYDYSSGIESDNDVDLLVE